MTQFSISAVWYPLGAIVCIGLVLAVSGIFARKSPVRKTYDKSRPWAFQLWEIPILRLRIDEAATKRRQSSLLESSYPTNDLDTTGHIAPQGYEQSQSTARSISKYLFKGRVGSENSRQKLTSLPETMAVKEISAFPETLGLA
jgi:hypothetical protein